MNSCASSRCRLALEIIAPSTPTNEPPGRLPMRGYGATPKSMPLLRRLPQPQGPLKVIATEPSLMAASASA